MKHWDERERADVAPARLSRQDRLRLRALLGEAPPRPRQRLHAGSMIGLALAIGLAVGLAFLLSPSDPVSTRLLN
jgi:hypothetical protein